MFGDLRPDTSGCRIDLSKAGDFDIGGMRVSPAHRQVCMNLDCRELEPRVVQVLVALASARPNVVSRDQLIQQCWDGRIVGDDALNRCIVALRHLARDFSPEPFSIETVPRVGYSLVERPGGNNPTAQRKTRMTLIAVCSSLLLLIGVLAFALPRLFSAEGAPASIALLPFRSLSHGDPYFAEGIGEEILSHLARDPQFRVAGRTSSSEFGPDATASDVGRRLHVDYIVEGSVRRQGDEVRVNADLVKASDGSRVWAESYDGKLDDIFAIQQSVGSAIAAALRRKLVRNAAAPASLVTNGEAYNLYLTARGLIRTRNKDVFATASNLLRDAIKLDPNYAPVWASLAESTYLEDYPNGSDGLIAAMPRAEGYARRALKLAPDLADGHRVLALLLPYGSPEALSHLRRAVELDQNSAEALLGLGSGLAAAGEFDAEMAAYKRARELDPVWFRTTGQLAIRFAETGQRASAEATARQGFANNPSNLRIMLGRIAWIFGDFSEAGRQWSIAAKANSPRWSPRARVGVNDVRIMVGLDRASPGYKPGFVTVHQSAGVETATAPTPHAWGMRNRNQAASDIYRDDNNVAAKLMLNAGRAQELAATYDGPFGLLSLRPNGPVRVDQLHEAAVVALALRQAGRAAEADQLLRKAGSTITFVYRQRTIPFVLDADVAAIWAVQGRRDEALSMLERAIRRGWTGTGQTDLANISEEPAFRTVHGDSRFERIRATLAAHLAQERTETVQLRI